MKLDLILCNRFAYKNIPIYLRKDNNFKKQTKESFISHTKKEKEDISHRKRRN